MGDSAITQCSLTTIQNKDANKLSALEQARKVKDADFTSRMNAIDDSIQTIQDELAAIADTVIPPGFYTDCKSLTVSYSNKTPK
jgi:hypothetical protein